MSRTDTALCMSLLATADLASRLTLPTLTDKLKISCRMIFLVGAILLTITREILAGTSSRRNLLIMSTIYGYVRAATVVNQNLTISEYASQDKLASALSLNMIAKGIFVMTIGQLLGICSIFEQANHITKKRFNLIEFKFYFFLGWIRDYTDSYTICLHAQDILLVIVIVIWLPEIVYRKYKAYNRNLNPVAI